jgi:hypothetical protein
MPVSKPYLMKKIHTNLRCYYLLLQPFTKVFVPAYEPQEFINPTHAMNLYKSIK